MTSRLSNVVRPAAGVAPAPQGASYERRFARGFGLIELVITVLIIAVLAAIAFPQYMRYTVKSKRVAAEACMASYANYMERYYTTYLRYDQAGSSSTATANTLALASLDCASNAQTGQNYDYSFDTNQPTATTYTILATPKGIQATKDTQCATLSLDQTNKRNISGTGSVSQCW